MDHLPQRGPAGCAEPFEARHLRLDRDALVRDRVDRQRAVQSHGQRGPGVGRRRRSAGRARELKRARPQPRRIRIETQDQLGTTFGDAAGQPVSETSRRVRRRTRLWPRAPTQGCYLTAFFSPAPAVNFGTFDAAI